MVAGGTSKLMTQMRRGAIEYCVLALLRDEDRYGFELTRALSDTDGLVTSEGNGLSVADATSTKTVSSRRSGRSLRKVHLAGTTA